jgi:hypothetical protein
VVSRNKSDDDILLARSGKPNARCFQKVIGRVLDVVTKVEEVSAAMRAVERESRDNLGENESAATRGIRRG